MSAPKGIGIVTAETTLLQSGKGLYLQSASDIALASGNRLSVNTKTQSRCFPTAKGCVWYR